MSRFAVETGVIELAELRLDPATVQAYIEGANAGLTRLEFRLLYALAEERGSVLSRRELVERVWGNGARRERAVDDVVHTLRTKIDRRAPRHAFLHTRPRVGYQIEPREKHGDVATAG
jgi:two-component system response regulator PrrA